MYHNGQWGTICDDFWSLPDARVVCRQLGYADAIAANGDSTYGSGSGPIHMDNVQCGGAEKNIGDCKFDGWGVHNCLTGETAGVVCGMENIRYGDGFN